MSKTSSVEKMGENLKTISWFALPELKKHVSISIPVRTSPKAFRMCRRKAYRALDEAINGIHSLPFEVLEIDWTRMALKQRFVPLADL